MTKIAVPKTIRTPRLTLRPLRPEDRQPIVEGVGNYEVSKWLSVVPYPYSLEDADAFIERSLTEGHKTWAIEDGKGLIGAIGCQTDVGYWLARPAWGKGYATEAGDAVVDHVFEETRTKSIRSAFSHGNAVSARVLDKIGFVPDGTREIDAVALAQRVTATTLILDRPRWRARRRFRVRTERLGLREFFLADTRAVMRTAGNEEVARNLQSVPLPWTEENARDWISGSRFRGRPGFRVAIRTRSGRIVGGIGLGRVAGSGPMTVMYWLGRAHWGKGYATEAMAGFMDEAYRRFPEIDVVEADHFTDNPASGRVLKKLGFIRIAEGLGTSLARLEPAPVIIYRVDRASFGVAR